MHPSLSLQGPRDFTKTLKVLLSGQNFQMDGLSKREACLGLCYFVFVVFILFCREVYECGLSELNSVFSERK